METKNILVVSTWLFVIIWLVGMLELGGDLLFALVLFFIAIAVSFVAMSIPAGGSGHPTPAPT